MAHSGDRHVAQRRFSDGFKQLHGHLNADAGGQLKTGPGRICSNRQGLSQGLGVVTVAEWSDDDEPLARWHIGCKAAVLVRTNVEPLVVSLVVQQEVVGDTVVGGVEQRTRDQVGVLERHIVGLIHGVETNTDGIKERLADQIVIGSVLIGGSRSVEQDIVASWGQRDGNDTRFAVVFSRVVDWITVLRNGLQGEVGCGSRAVLKGAILCGIQVDVHLNLNRLWVRNDLHGGDGFGAGAVDRQVLNGRSVQSLIGEGNGPHTVRQVKRKVTKFVRRGGPHQTGGVGSHHLRRLPKRERRIPAGGVVVEMDNAVHQTGWFDVQHAQIGVDAGSDLNQRTVAAVGDDAFGGQVVGEAGRDTNGEVPGDVGHG